MCCSSGEDLTALSRPLSVTSISPETARPRLAASLMASPFAVLEQRARLVHLSPARRATTFLLRLLAAFRSDARAPSAARNGSDLARLRLLGAALRLLVDEGLRARLSRRRGASATAAHSSRLSGVEPMKRVAHPSSAGRQLQLLGKLPTETCHLGLCPLASARSRQLGGQVVVQLALHIHCRPSPTLLRRRECPPSVSEPGATLPPGDPPPPRRDRLTR